MKTDIMPCIFLQLSLKHHNSPNIFLQCTLEETPNYKFENGGLLLDQYLSILFLSDFFQYL